MQLTSEISDAISNPVAMGSTIDEDEIKAELEALEQEELNDRLIGADKVPVHSPGVAERGASPPFRFRLRFDSGLMLEVAAPASRTAAQRRQEEDEDAELKELQAALAM